VEVVFEALILVFDGWRGITVAEQDRGYVLDPIDCGMAKGVVWTLGNPVSEELLELHEILKRKGG
jgi:hypothetical protein